MKTPIAENNLEDIMRIIEKYDLMSTKRDRHLIYKRAFVYNFLYNKKFTLTQIARIFNKNHATVLNGLKVYKSMVDTNDSCFQDSIIDIGKEFIKQKDFFNDSLVNDIHEALVSNDNVKAKLILNIIFKILTGIEHNNLYKQIIKIKYEK